MIQSPPLHSVGQFHLNSHPYLTSPQRQRILKHQGGKKPMQVCIFCGHQNKVFSNPTLARIVSKVGTKGRGYRMGLRRYNEVLPNVLVNTVYAFFTNIWGKNEEYGHYTDRSDHRINTCFLLVFRKKRMSVDITRARSLNKCIWCLSEQTERCIKRECL